MSEADKESLLKIAGNRFAKEPFLHLVILCVIGGVVFLAHIQRSEVIPWLAGCGLAAIVIAGVGIVIQWIACRMEAVVESFDRMSSAYPTLAENQRVMSHFVMALSEEFARSRHTLLLIEDNPLHQRMIREYLLPIMDEFNLTFVLATTLREGIAMIRQAKIAIIDVNLEDNGSTASINMLIQLLSGQCPVVIHSGTEFSLNTFPQASAVLLKGESINEKGLIIAVRKALKRTGGTFNANEFHVDP